MGNKTRVVVTGLGAITPIGNDVASFWQGLKDKKVGIAPITYFDTTDYKAKLAGEVKDFDPKKYMDPKAARRMEPFSQYAVAAAGEAIAQAGLDMEKEDPFRVGTSIGSGIGSLQAMEREHKKMLEKGPNRVNPLLVPMMISNMAVGNVAMHYGLKGKSINVVTACATGTNSIGEAFRSIQYGEADVMVAGGTESAITPLGMAGFAALTALSVMTGTASRRLIGARWFRHGRGRWYRSSGVLRARAEAWRKDSGRGSRLRRKQRCIPHHFPGRGWKRRSVCDGDGAQGCRYRTGED